jgi:hypothetical protein
MTMTGMTAKGIVKFTDGRYNPFHAPEMWSDTEADRVPPAVSTWPHRP